MNCRSLLSNIYDFGIDWTCSTYIHNSIFGVSFGHGNLWDHWFNFLVNMYDRLALMVKPHHLIGMVTADYIIVITGRAVQGQFMGHDIYQATDFDFLPLRALSPNNPPHPVEAHLLALVRSHLHGGNFLFSYTWDLTRRLQVQWENREEDASKAFWQVVRECLCFSLSPMLTFSL